jgi:hypothetical protein
MFANGLGRHEQAAYKTFHRCFLPSFGSFGWAASEGKIKTTDDGNHLAIRAIGKIVG